MAESTIANELEARPLAEQAVRAVAAQAAEAAAEATADKMAAKIVEGIFLHLGIDVHDREAMNRLKDDLGFLQRMNRGAREIKQAAVRSCVGALIMGVLSVMLIGLKNYFSSN